MTKIDTDGSGVSIVLVGCPYCERAPGLRYYLSRWTIDPCRDDGMHATPVWYCPGCGMRLPSLHGWQITR